MIFVDMYSGNRSVDPERASVSAHNLAEEQVSTSLDLRLARILVRAREPWPAVIFRHDTDLPHVDQHHPRTDPLDLVDATGSVERVHVRADNIPLHAATESADGTRHGRAGFQRRG